ncbi:DUF11 domain-containing protein [Ketobacter sp.]|uniref:DUF11 domain-containing protein n=1 Tax=Ketobacter sp. TaxID=2083498 RepID=UPI000F2C0E5D|nr:DUF11 domain-containing protein [Ketobacter sp.]RLU00326.1 MAG: hypothetical protein D9N14_07495 [Ketobacter sp.]
MNTFARALAALSLSVGFTINASADNSVALETFFNNNINPQLQLCGVCHIPNGLADVEEGNGFLLYPDRSHYQSFYDAWVILGEGVNNNRLLTMNSDPALNHTGLQNWPTSSAHYRNVETLLTCWDQPELCPITPPQDSADLAVTMVGNNGKNNGGVINYRINVSNAGPSTADSLEITHLLPAQATLSEVTPDSIAYTTAGREVTFYLDTLTMGSSQGIELTVNTAIDNNTLMSFTSAVSAITEDTNPSNNSSTAYFGGGVVSDSADLSVTMAGNNGKNQDGVINYSLTVKNAGPNTANAVKIAHRIPNLVTLNAVTPSSIAYTSVGKLITFNLDSLASGTSQVINIKVTTATDNKDKMDFSATVSAATEDPNSANNTSTEKFGGSINGWVLLISALALLLKTRCQQRNQ